MKQFWLGDVRPRREARLIEIDADDITPVLRQVGDGTAVMVGIAEYAPRLLNSRLRAVRLAGAAPVIFHVACRRTDRRGVVRALVGAFQAVSPRHLL
ncbi:hypothetical protein JOL79_29865 [Microbispora sp. RL4-1S]|uniref:Uncharacterized protein n=1 Tax=Microbispora oryzae TaxID=2806554 RepID=A0A940WW47_9ACTN|nr:hypothetical protein [Microbispora oryzae]MBP2707994.1 hypothetical protein [Microbispora oryzae]